MANKIMVVHEASRQMTWWPKDRPLPDGVRHATSDDVEGREVPRRNDDPIVWCSTSSEATARARLGGNNARRRLLPDGTLTIERLPQLSHIGDPPVGAETPKMHPQAENRYVEIVRHDGNQVHLALTCGASLCTPKDLDNSYTKYLRMKMRHFGWFPVGECIVQLVRRGYIARSRIVATELLDSQPCNTESFAGDEFGCAHNLAERAARRNRSEATQAAKLAELSKYDAPTGEAIAAASSRAVIDGLVAAGVIKPQRKLR